MAPRLKDFLDVDDSTSLFCCAPAAPETLFPAALPPLPPPLPAPAIMDTTTTTNGNQNNNHHDNNNNNNDEQLDPSEETAMNLEPEPLLPNNHHHHNDNHERVTTGVVADFLPPRWHQVRFAPAHNDDDDDDDEPEGGGREDDDDNESRPLHPLATAPHEVIMGGIESPPSLSPLPYHHHHHHHHWESMRSMGLAQRMTTATAMTPPPPPPSRPVAAATAPETTRSRSNPPPESLLLPLLHHHPQHQQESQQHETPPPASRRLASHGPATTNTPPSLAYSSSSAATTPPRSELAPPSPPRSTVRASSGTSSSPPPTPTPRRHHHPLLRRRRRGFVALLSSVFRRRQQQQQQQQQQQHESPRPSSSLPSPRPVSVRNTTATTTTLQRHEPQQQPPPPQPQESVPSEARNQGRENDDHALLDFHHDHHPLHVRPIYRCLAFDEEDELMDEEDDDDDDDNDDDDLSWEGSSLEPQEPEENDDHHDEYARRPGRSSLPDPALDSFSASSSPSPSPSPPPPPPTHLPPPPPPAASYQKRRQQQRRRRRQRQRRLLPLVDHPHHLPCETHDHPHSDEEQIHTKSAATTKSTRSCGHHHSPRPCPPPMLKLDPVTTRLKDLKRYMDFFWQQHNSNSNHNHNHPSSCYYYHVLELLLHALMESRVPRLVCLAMQLLAEYAQRGTGAVSPTSSSSRSGRHSRSSSSSRSRDPNGSAPVRSSHNSTASSSNGHDYNNQDNDYYNNSSQEQQAQQQQQKEQFLLRVFTPRVLEWITRTLWQGDSILSVAAAAAAATTCAGGSAGMDDWRWWCVLSQEYAAQVVRSLTVYPVMDPWLVLASHPPHYFTPGNHHHHPDELNSMPVLPSRLLHALAHVLVVGQDDDDDDEGELTQFPGTASGGTRQTPPRRLAKNDNNPCLFYKIGPPGVYSKSTPPLSPPPLRKPDPQPFSLSPIRSSGAPQAAATLDFRHEPQPVCYSKKDHAGDNNRLAPRPLFVPGRMTEQTRIHAVVAIMNLSCGPANNKIAMASCPPLLFALKTILLANGGGGGGGSMSDVKSSRGSTTYLGSTTPQETLRLKAANTLKNLSNLERNDEALVQFPGLVQALGRAVLQSTLQDHVVGATDCTTHACTALMNLSVSKHFKCLVYHTPGVMQALLTVLARTNYLTASVLQEMETEQDDAKAPQQHPPRHLLLSAYEARVRTCSILSNLAIGYDNKLSMFHYPGLVDSMVRIIVSASGEDRGGGSGDDRNHDEELRSKACSILWSLAAEKENQVPMVAGDKGVVVPVLIEVARERWTSESRQKCVAALTLLAEASDNALPLMQAGLLPPLLRLLFQAGSDPTQWKDPTASWCVSCLMNLAQVHHTVPFLHQAGAVQILAPLVIQDQQYQSLKAAMAVLLLCYRRRRHHDSLAAAAAAGTTLQAATRCLGEWPEPLDNHPDYYYTLLRQTESAIPQMVQLLYNTLARRGGEGYKYGVFTLSSSVACIAAVAGGPEYLQEQICGTRTSVSAYGGDDDDEKDCPSSSSSSSSKNTGKDPSSVVAKTVTTPVLVSLLQVLWDFCVDGGIAGTIVGGGRDDVESAQWALEAVHSMISYLRSHTPMTRRNILPCSSLTKPLLHALHCAMQRFGDLVGDSYQWYQSLAAHTIELMEMGGDRRPLLSNYNNHPHGASSSVTSTTPMEYSTTSMPHENHRHSNNNNNNNKHSLLATPTKKRKQPDEETAWNFHNNNTNNINSRYGSPVSVILTRHNRNLSSSSSSSSSSSTLTSAGTGHSAFSF